MKPMTINKFRGMLYKTAKILGDVQALTHKTPSKAIPKRIARRIVGKAAGKAMGKLFR